MQMPTRNEAFTYFELIFVIAALLLLAMLMPWRHSSNKLSCINYLEQIGVGFRLNANDIDGKLPKQLSTNVGGTLEYTNAGQAYRHFLAASNEITRADVLVCPDDRKRAAVVDFSSNSRNSTTLTLVILLTSTQTNQLPKVFSRATGI